MSRGCEPEDNNPSDNIQLLFVLGLIPRNHKDGCSLQGPEPRLLLCLYQVGTVIKEQVETSEMAANWKGCRR